MDDLAGITRDLMPELTADLERLVRIPSIAFPDHPREPVQEACSVVAELFRGAGVDVDILELPDTSPVVTGSIPAPPGAPTVLLYSHYDVVPAGDEALWDSPPFQPAIRDGAMYGRGASDSKANVLGHVGSLRAWKGAPPVGIRLVIEGQEELGGGALTQYPEQDPARFAADAMLIADAGSVRPGEPSLTVALRGMANVFVGVTALASAKHSGQYGGAAPDALLTLLHALGTLHDEHGDVAVPGLRREEWTGGGYTEQEFRELAEVRDGLPLLGTGGLGSRLWSGPAITVIGIDVTPVEKAVNAVPPSARAKLNVRVHPGQDPARAQQAVIDHLRGLRPFGIALEVEAGELGDGFSTGTSGAAYTAARSAMESAWGRPPVDLATGGSIPLVAALQRAVPDAEILLLGATDGYSNIHGPNERVLLDELQKAVQAEAEFFARFAADPG